MNKPEAFYSLQEYKDWAKKKVSNLVDQHAAQRGLFNEYYDKGDHDNTTYYRIRMEETMTEILAFIE